MNLTSAGRDGWSLTMQSFSFKVSLQSLLLLVTLIGVTLAYGLSRVKNRELRVRNYALERQNEWERKVYSKETGLLNVIDPSKGYVRRLGPTDGMVWRYRLHLPADKDYQLKFAQKWKADGTPVAQTLAPTLQRPGGSEEQIITVGFRQDDGGRWSYHVNGPSFKRRGGTFQVDMKWMLGYAIRYNHDWPPAKYVYDHSEQIGFDPDQTLVLLTSRRPGRPGVNLSTLTSGIAFWICPINAKDPPK